MNNQDVGSTPSLLARTMLRRHRIAISAMFAIAGTLIGTWTARIPAIQHRLDLTDGRLSIALLALAVGGLVGMRLAGRLVDGHGSCAVMAATALMLGALLVSTAYAPSLSALAVVLLVLGAVHGTLNVAMNAAAVACQAAYRRPIMTAFHAQFSIGGVAGAAISASCARAHLSAAVTFVIVGVGLIVAAIVAQPHLSLPVGISATVEHRFAGDKGAGSAPRGRVVLLGLLAFCALISEGAAADWSSVYLDRLGASPAYVAAAYAAFAGCMTIGRLLGDRITAALKPVTLLRGCGLIAAIGLTIGLTLGSPLAAVVGFGCLGAGLSCVIPLLYSTAGNLNLDRPGAALSRVSALGYLGYVTGPVIIGGAATPLGLGHALLLLPVLAAVLVVAAPVVKPAADNLTPTAEIDPASQVSGRAGQAP